IGLVLAKRPVLLATITGFLLVGACAAVEAAVVATFRDEGAEAGYALEFWSLSFTLLIAGICIAPALAVMFSIVSASVKFSDTAEAYGWVGTGQLIGAAIGSAVAGLFIDRVGPGGAFWTAAGFAFLGFLIPTIFHRWHPDLRGRDASPLPDTEAIPVQS